MRLGGISLRRSLLLIIIALFMLVLWPWPAGGNAQSTTAAVLYLPCVYSPLPTPTPTLIPGDVPVLLSPACGSNVTTVAPELVWLAAGTYWYGVDIATDPSFAQVAARVSPRSYLTGPERRTPLLINLQPGVQYYWRVGYEATPGSYVWSLSESFVTGDMGDLPRAPMLVLPESGTTVYSLKPHLTWEQLAGADMYLVTLGVNGNSFTYNILSPYPELNVPFPLLAGRTYAWRVKARNASGWGPDSTVQLLVTAQNAMAD